MKPIKYCRHKLNQLQAKSSSHLQTFVKVNLKLFVVVSLKLI